MMMRRLYCLILGMHPPTFRHRFREEMMSIFEEAAAVEPVAGLLSDALLSLIRQWLRLTSAWTVLIAICGSMLQVVWFVYPRRAHQAWPETEVALTPYMQEWISVALATICGLFILVLSFAVWNARRRSIRRRPRQSWNALLVLLCAVTFSARGQTTKELDRSSHQTQFIRVDHDVKLEVLDWGGTGRALVFLAGSGFDAHVFDDFAPKFTSMNHVYAITRRGFGSSNAPEPTDDNYSADRLGDDVLAVLEALKLDRPVLVGHSLAGEELSSLGSRYPGKVAGLIYLDAGYSYAFYSPQLGDPIIDAMDLNRSLALFLSRGFQDSKEMVALQQASGRLDQDLQALGRQRALMPPQPPRPANAPRPPLIGVAMSKGRRKYTHISVPVLAIFADPHDFGSLYKDDPKARAAVLENDRATTSAQADAFQAGVPSARVIRIANADHFIFKSNEAEILREMNAFLSSLP